MPIPELCIAGNGGGGGGGGGDTPGGGGGNSGGGMPVLALVTNQDKTVTVQLQTSISDDTPVDLTNVDSIKFVAKEMLFHQQLYIEKTLDPPVTPTDGTVVIDFDPADIPYAGMWYAAIILYDATPNIIGEYRMWLEVRKGLTQNIPHNTPISIAEVRLMARDAEPEANNLLLDYEWSDTEIAFAIMRPIEEWNESLPPVTTYTGATFPYREHWRKATLGYLMRTAARKYLRDDLQYSAGGLTINDKRKWDAYGKLGQDLVDEWRTWMKQEKVRINSLACYGYVGSPAYNGYRIR